MFSQFLLFKYRNNSIKKAGISENIDKNDIEQIEQWFDEIVDKEDDSYFSKPLYFYLKLKSERYCIYKIWLINEHKDNDVYKKIFICKGLIINDGYISFHPICILDSPLLDLDVDLDKKEIEVYPLINTIYPGDTITFERIKEFVCKRINSGFLDMLYSVLQYNNLKKSTYIFDNDENIYMWIAALSMVFPIEFSKQITFSTAILHSNALECNIFALSNKSSILSFYKDKEAINSIILKEYNIFDYNENIITKFNADINFMKLAIAGYTASKAILNTFHKHMKYFDYHILNEEIEGCYNLFIIMNVKSSNYNKIYIKSAFEFAYKYTLEDAFEDIFNKIEHNLNAIIHSLDYDPSHYLLLFLLKTASKINKNVIKLNIFRIILDYIDYIVFDTKYDSVDNLYEIYNIIEENGLLKENQFIKYIISEEHCVYILSKVAQCNINGVYEFYLYLILNSFILFDYYWKQAINIKDMSTLIDICIVKICEYNLDIKKIIDACISNCEYMSTIAVLFYNRIKNNDALQSLLKYFIEAIDLIEKEKVLKIRKKIFELECGKLLYEEFLYRLYNEEDKVLFFNNYNADVFDKMFDYSMQYFSDAVKAYIQKLSFEFVYDECMNILNGFLNNTYTLEDTALSIVIKGIEDSIGFIDLSEATINIAAKLDNIKKNRNIKTSPNITSIIMFLINLDKANELFELNQITNELKDIDLLDDKRRDDFNKIFLPKIIKFTYQPKDHGLLLHIIQNQSNEKYAYELYMNSLNLYLLNSETEGIKILESFCIYYFYYLEIKLKMLNDTENINYIKNKIIEIINNHSLGFLRNLDNGIRDGFLNMGLSLPIQWTEIYNDVLQKKNVPFLKRLSNLLKRKEN